MPMMSSDDLWEGIRHLCWHQHEGSGTTLTLADVWSLDFKRFIEWVEWIQTRRNAEAAAIRKANR